MSTILDKKRVALRAGRRDAGPAMAHLGLNAACRAPFTMCNPGAEVDAPIDAPDLAPDMFA